jgi:hypothetical protein
MRGGELAGLGQPEPPPHVGLTQNLGEHFCFTPQSKLYVNSFSQSQIFATLRHVWLLIEINTLFSFNNLRRRDSSRPPPILPNRSATTYFSLAPPEQVGYPMTHLR